jgi:hypothetical protein
MRITSAEEQKQDLLLADGKGAKTVIRRHDGVIKKGCIKGARPWQIHHIETSFQNRARKSGSMLAHDLGFVAGTVRRYVLRWILGPRWSEISKTVV